LKIIKNFFEISHWVVFSFLFLLFSIIIFELGLYIFKEEGIWLSVINLLLLIVVNYYLIPFLNKIDQSIYKKLKNKYVFIYIILNDWRGFVFVILIIILILIFFFFPIVGFWLVASLPLIFSLIRALKQNKTFPTF
jgi:hypothetical protein